jgi:hypothetical protein
MMTTDELNEAIRQLCEKRGMKFAPWEIAPWDCDEGPNPWGDNATNEGGLSWPKAVQLRRKLITEIEAAQPYDTKIGADGWPAS